MPNCQNCCIPRPPWDETSSHASRSHALAGHRCHSPRRAATQRTILLGEVYTKHRSTQVQETAPRATMIRQYTRHRGVSSAIHGDRGNSFVTKSHVRDSTRTIFFKCNCLLLVRLAATNFKITNARASHACEAAPWLLGREPANRSKCNCISSTHACTLNSRYNLQWPQSTVPPCDQVWDSDSWMFHYRAPARMPSPTHPRTPCHAGNPMSMVSWMSFSDVDVSFFAATRIFNGMHGS